MGTLLEHLGIRLVTDSGVKQIQLGNNSGITWVPGVRAVRLRYGRAWTQLHVGQQSLRLRWGLSEPPVDKSGDVTVE